MVIELKEKMVDLLFSGELPSVFFFVPNKAKAEEEPDQFGGWFKEDFRRVAKERRGDYYFAYSGLDRGVELRVAQILGVNALNVPCIFIAKGNN